LERDDLSEKKLLLLDGNSLINRAFYGLYGRHNLTAPDGTPTGALFAFFNMLLKLMDDVQPTHVAAAFDRREPTFRHQRFAEYKGTRKPTPEELVVQIPLLKELLQAFGVTCVELAGYEADDLIGTLARIGAAKMPVTIVSGDKDSFQLAGEQVQILQPVTRSGKTETEHYDPAAIQERYQVTPRQFIDVKALMGDSSDNIPGVRGIGEKTAIELVSQYGSLEAIYAALDELRPAVAKKLAAEREQAWLSRELAEICLNAPLESDLEQYRLQQPDEALLAEQLSRLGFRTLLSRLNLVAKTDALTQRQSVVHPVTPAELAADLEKRSDPVALLLEPDRPVCWLDQADRVCCLQAADLREVWSLLSQQPVRYLVYDYKSFLRQTGLTGTLSCVHDIQIAAYLLSQLENRADLERLYQRVTGDMLPMPDVDSQQNIQQRQQDLFSMPESTKEAEAASQTDEHAAVRLRAIHTIGCVQRDELDKRNLLFISDDVEFPLAAILADMEQRGFALDQDVLQQLSREMARRIDLLQEDIHKMCGRTFNINSPKQMSEVLFDDLGLKTGKKRSGGTWSTDADELERLADDHPVIPLIIEYRQMTKLRASFVDSLMKLIDPQDGRVHTTFNQTLTTTGRLSSSEPNLQNIPIRTAEGRKIRRAFVAAPGHLLIDADYSQIELRLLAHLSGDPAMIEAFNKRQDIHTDTACRIFGVNASEVSTDMRAIAKTMNFSIVYGISDFGLARDLGVTVRQAHKWISEYEARYPRIRAYLDSLVTAAKKNGYVETLFGRRRYLQELSSASRNVRQFGERAAMNTPIQGTAADMIKIAMVRADRSLKQAGLNARLILQVHDELIVEAQLDEADRAAEILQEAMEQAMKLDVPLVAEICRGHSWAECKEKIEDDPDPAESRAPDSMPEQPSGQHRATEG
jgi:DNA polymerase I